MIQQTFEFFSAKEREKMNEIDKRFTSPPGSSAGFKTVPVETIEKRWLWECRDCGKYQESVSFNFHTACHCGSWFVHRIGRKADFPEIVAILEKQKEEV